MSDGKQEQKQEQELKELFNKRMREGFPVTVPSGFELKDGDKFTAAGVQHLSDGTMIMNCKPGEETVMIAKVEA